MIYINILRELRCFPDSVYLNDTKSTNGEETVKLFADHFKEIYTPNFDDPLLNNNKLDNI